MGIMSLEPDSTAVNNTQSLPTVLATPRDSLFTPLYPEAVEGTLLQYVEGYPWTCHWYGQITHQSNSLVHFDPHTPNLTQPVYEIQDLVLQVESPISSNYDINTATTIAVGSALTPLGVVPNVGDFFIAPVDTGEDAIFCISQVERKTHRKQSLYFITYVLYKYLSQDEGFAENIRKRVQQTYHFNQDLHYPNREVLVTTPVKEARINLKAFLQESQSYYLQTFSDPRAGTIILPGTSQTLYDPLLLAFVGSFIDHDLKISHSWFQHRFNDRYLNQRSVWDLLRQRSPAMVSSINREYGFVRTGALRNFARLGTIGHTPMELILYPKRPQTHTDVSTLHYEGPVNSFEDALGPLPPTPILPIKSGNQASDSVVPLLHALFAQDTYVVSPAFYTALGNRDQAVEGLSFMETLMLRFIRKEAIALEDLSAVARTFYDWPSLHQLYLLPVVWLLVRASL